MSNPGSPKYKDLQINLTGSTKFGRYPTMSSEQTYNMIFSDNWAVPFAGYKRVAKINPTGVGRGIYTSNKLGKMFAVIDDGIYTFDQAIAHTRVGSTTTSFGDVFISENNAGEVVFSDSVNLYIYNNSTNLVTTLFGGATRTTASDLGFIPGYLSYQNGRIVSPDLSSNQWRLSEPNQCGTTSGGAVLNAAWPFDAQHVGAIQTKPDRAVACIRFPGLGNLLYVFGATVSEPWQDVGLQLFPYQRSTSSNVDYGCLNPATIAESEDIVCWLGINEKSGPTIMYSNGRTVDHLSTDGIDFKLARLINPANSYGFMFKQDGHLFYVITFVEDNLTYAYDWKNQAFYTLSDENLSYFIAKRVAFFNDQYYFVSINDGNLYQIGTQFPSYDYGDGVVHEIPRIRILPEIKLGDQSYFICGYAGFKIESGITDGTQRVDLSVSKDSGVNFGSVVSKTLPELGHRTNRLMFWQLGNSNTLTMQFRFYGFQRFLITDGITGIFQ